MKPSERIRELLQLDGYWENPNEGMMEQVENRINRRIDAIIEYLDEVSLQTKEEK